MNWPRNRIKFKIPCRLKSESGQGILEYILVLIITVAIILGFMWKFSESFQSWANNYFGEYLACLLETGEIPSIGGLGGGQGICNQSFEAFTFTAGRPPKSEGGEGGNGGGGGGQGSNQDSNSRNKGDRVGYAGQVGGGGGGGSSRFRVTSGPEMAGGGGSRASGAGSKAEKTYTGSTESSMPGGIYNQQEGPKVIRMKTIDRNFAFQREKEEQEKAKARIPLKKNAGGMTNKNDRIPVRKIAVSEDEQLEEEEMSFGDFFRFLIIAAIIIALVVFIGGQALQVGKSMD